MTSPRARLLRTVALALVAVVLPGLAGWLAWGLAEPSASTPVSVRSATGAASPASVSSSPRDARPGATEGTASPFRAPAPHGASAGRTDAAWAGLGRAPGCGWKEAEFAGYPDLQEMGRRSGGGRFVAAMKHLQETLHDAPDPYQNALYWWLALEGPGSVTNRTSHIVALALANADPRLQSLAHARCDVLASRAPAGCARLSTQAWAAADPGNGWPWMLAATSPGASESARAEAVRELARSTVIDAREALPAGTIAAMFPGDDDMAAAVHAATALAVGQGAAEPSRFPELRAFCLDARRRGTSSAEDCVRVAALMLSRSTDLATASLGGALDVLMTDDTSRRDRMRAEHRALVEALVEEGEPGAAPKDCAGLRILPAMLRRQAEVGQIAELRERAARRARSGPG